MNRTIVTLSLILAIQLALTVVVYWPHDKMSDSLASEQLLPFSPDTIDEVYVADENGDEAILLKMGQQWILPDLTGLPIDSAMVDKLFSALDDNDSKWAVATTIASRQRFQVAAYHFQRRLTLISKGELLGSIYLGTSPGFRKVHARNDIQEAIYSIPFNNFDAPADSAGWLDKTLLQTRSAQTIEIGGASVSRHEEQWVSSSGGVIDQREMAALRLGLEAIQVNGVADEDMQRTLAIAVPALSLHIIADDYNRTLQLFTVGEHHYAKSDRYDFFFTLSAYDFDRLASIDLKRLIGIPPP
ncbi:MAG: DUF4340 domain-containing protein [Halioglobus sp.]